MATKRMRISTSAYLSDDFSFHEQERIFFQEFANKVTLSVISLDASVFQECDFYKILEKSNSKGFIYNYPRKVYPSLVKTSTQISTT